MKAKISPGKRKYEKMQAIASKSYVHRYLIAAALAGEVTTLYTDILSEDMLATMDCLNAIGASAMRIKGGIRIVPMRKDSELCKPTLKCRESGSTARFMLPVMSALFPAFCMEGEGRLPNRPFAPICKALKENGVETSGNYLPMYVQGRLKAGTFSISGNVSSQYITGLLFALPLLEDDSKIMLTSKLESKGYIDITISVLKEFGIQVEETEYGYFVPGNQTYCSPGIIYAPGDWSNAAFFLCMGALGEGVMLTGLNQEDLQGDRAVVDGGVIGANSGGQVAAGGFPAVLFSLGRLALCPNLQIVQLAVGNGVHIGTEIVEGEVLTADPVGGGALGGGADEIIIHSAQFLAVYTQIDHVGAVCDLVGQTVGMLLRGINAMVGQANSVVFVGRTGVIANGQELAVLCLVQIR